MIKNEQPIYSKVLRYIASLLEHELKEGSRLTVQPYGVAELWYIKIHTWGAPLDTESIKSRGIKTEYLVPEEITALFYELLYELRPQRPEWFR
jgi:hypothetical protein